MQIRDYEFGKIIVNGKEYTNDLIVFPNKIKNNWWRKEGHNLQIEDLEEVFKYESKILIIGTGSNGLMKVSSKVKEKCKQKGIDLKIYKSKKACKEYNKEEDAVLAIHLTC